MELNNVQNLRGIEILLNAFGLILDDSMQEKTKYDILTKNGLKAGTVHCANKILVEADTAFGHLSASANYAEAMILKDSEIPGHYGAYAQWAPIIKLNVGNKLIGDIQVIAKMDTEFGVNIICSPRLTYDDGKNKFTFKFQCNGETFGYESAQETIKIMPFDDLNGYIIHRKGKRSDRTGKKYKIKMIKRKDDQEKNWLSAVAHIEENHKVLKHTYEIYEKKNPDDNAEESVIQKGQLMQKIDPEMYKLLKDIRKLLTTQDIYLFDNLISLSLNNYSDEEIKSLLGLNIKKLIYQDGFDNLSDTYFVKTNPKVMKLYKKIIS